MFLLWAIPVTFMKTLITCEMDTGPLPVGLHGVRMVRSGDGISVEIEPISDIWLQLMGNLN